MGIVYHGSPVVGLKTLTPHQSTHGNYVYATKEKLVALILSGKYGDDMTFSLFRNGHDDPWKLVERIPNGFATMFNNSASIYTLNDDSFKDIQTGFSEVVSEKELATLSEERIDSVYAEIKKLAQEGKIKVYQYPSKPKGMAENDKDLLQKELKQLERNNKTLTKNTFFRLLLLHPNLFDEVNKVLQEHNLEAFKKDDLITIFFRAVIFQELYPEEELYLESAVIAISRLFPEYVDKYKEKLHFITYSEAEKRKFFLNNLNLLFPELSEAEKEALQEKYQDDNRDFKDIGIEIIADIKKHKIEKATNRTI